MKYIYLLISVLMSIGTLNAQQALPDYCPKPMVLVYYGDWYPYFFKHGDDYKGIDYEFVMSVTKQLGCQIKVSPLPEKRIHQNLAKGSPLIMAGASYTKARAQTQILATPIEKRCYLCFF